MSDRATALHASRHKGVFYITGGGTGLIDEMMTTAGASRTVLEVRVPYAAQALSDLLGSEPEQACSSRTARALAMAALQHALTFPMDKDEIPFGLGCTASLATDRIKKGRHRAHVAIQTIEATWHANIEFNSDRAAEEAELLEHLWSGLSHMFSRTQRLPFERITGHHGWQALVSGNSSAHVSHPHDGLLLFPGSFAPLHHGHTQMMKIAEQRLGRTGAYEISIQNPDKPLLDYLEIATRLGQFEQPVWLTRLPSFVEKAVQFPQATFIVGIDTLTRISSPRYYDSIQGRDLALAKLAEQAVRFLVFGRLDGGEFMHLEDFNLPQKIVDLCSVVTEQEFRQDVSSSSIRGALP